MVGNDVVDLGDPAIAHHHHDERFVARVCAPEERPRVASKLDLWTLFAAKEAAYKALVQLGFSPGFGHRAIVVAPTLRSVTWRDCELALRVGSDAERVHAVAWAGSVEPRASLGPAGEDPGGAARALLCEVVAGLVGCDPLELTVGRDPAAGAWDDRGPPYTMRRGDRVAVDVSLSHDGRFVAAAARLGANLSRE